MTYQLTNEISAHHGVNVQAVVSRAFGALRRVVAGGLAAYLRKRRARIDRAAFKQMLLLDNEILDDIGVTRANVEWASRLPIEQSAAQALESTKVKRARPKIRP